MVEGHRLRVAEVQPRLGLGDNDGKAAVGGEIQVVGIGHRDVGAALARLGIDRREGIALVVGHVDAAKIPRRHDMLRQSADGEVIDHLVRLGVDHVDGIAAAVRHVHAIQRALDVGAELIGSVVRVDVARLHRKPCGRRGG